MLPPSNIFYEQLDIETKPASKKAEIIKNVITVIVVAVVMLSLLSIGIFYSLDLFDIYKPEQDFSFNIRTANIMTTLNEFEKIAQEHQNSRAIDLGYNASLNYVHSQLDENYFDVSIQDFTVTLIENVATPTFAISSPTPFEFTEGVDFQTITYSGSGSLVNIPVFYVGTGCTNESYAGFPEGFVALSVRTSECRTSFKCTLAQQNLASAFLIYNNEEGLFSVSAGDPFAIPLLAISNEAGSIILNYMKTAEVEVSIYTEVREVYQYTSNLIAETKSGDSTNVIVSGSHLDSVPAGPGINDNGSGSASNLEIAHEMAIMKVQPVNKVRFAWWGAEELGLKGSEYYVSQLTTTERQNIALNLNFDMIGSPNFMRGIYNGTQGPESIRTQCETLSSLFVDFFESHNLTWGYSDFSGRSDYAPFLDVGIPAGGLDTGMEELKTISQREHFGGIANTAFDPCYHQPCDTVQNINRQVLSELARAASQIIYNLSMKTDLRSYLLNPST